MINPVTPPGHAEALDGSPPWFPADRVGLSFADWREASLRRIDGRAIVVSLSGGKDSTAVAALLQLAGIPYRCLHMDTGWEDQTAEDYVRRYLPTVLTGRIDIVGYPGGMEALVQKRGMFPSRLVRFCTEELKVKPAKEFIRRLQDEGHDPINAVGIRREEGATGNDRGTAEEWDTSDHFDCTVWRPVVMWTLADIVAVHEAAGILPNPLYLQGAERVGCFPCIFAAKAEIRFIAEREPARIARIASLEARVGDPARLRETQRVATALAVLREGGSTASAVAAIQMASPAITRLTAERSTNRAVAVQNGETTDLLATYKAPTWFQARRPIRAPQGHFRCDGRGNDGAGCCALLREDATTPLPAAWALHADPVRMSLTRDEVETAVAVGLLPAIPHAPGCNGTKFSRYVVRSGGMLPILDAVQWSRTKWGSDEVADDDGDAFLASEGEKGCARWGLCALPTGDGSWSANRPKKE